MKRLFATIAVLMMAVCTFAGDAAAFVDLGFSRDGKTYVFGQYGKTDGNFHGYAEIYTVDVKQNDFVSKGVFKTTDKSGKTGSVVFSKLQAKHKSFLDSYGLSPVDADSMLYMREDTSKGGSAEITFKDFESSTPVQEVVYTVRLVPLFEGSGANTKSSFYIVAEKKNLNGELLARFVAGNPGIQRAGVTGYAIDRIYTTPDGKGFVFVVEKRVEDATGISIRYMVETVIPPATAIKKVPEAAPEVPATTTINPEPTAAPAVEPVVPSETTEVIKVPETTGVSEPVESPTVIVEK